MPDDRPTLLLLDGHSLAYRAFYALPDTLRTQTGDLTNAVYGFTSMLIKMLAERRPDAITVAFDKGRDVARTEAYPEYKANRSSPPDEFRPQVDLIKQVLASMQIPVVEVPGVEADWHTEEGGLRLRPDFWADQGGMDGFYIACLRKD